MSVSRSESYKAAGVDVTAGYEAVKLMKPMVESTFTKGVMGMVAGLAMKDRETPAYGRCTVSAALGCVAYYILYFFKSFAYDGLLMGGLTASVAAAALPLKIPASLFNGAVAIILAPPLCVVLRRSLKRTHIQLP